MRIHYHHLLLRTTAMNDLEKAQIEFLTMKKRYRKRKNKFLKTQRGELKARRHRDSLERRYGRRLADKIIADTIIRENRKKALRRMINLPEEAFVDLDSSENEEEEETQISDFYPDPLVVDLTKPDLVDLSIPEVIDLE